MVKLSKQVKEPAKSHIFWWLYKPRIVVTILVKCNDTVFVTILTEPDLFFKIRCELVNTTFVLGFNAGLVKKSI